MSKPQRALKYGALATCAALAATTLITTEVSARGFAGGPLLNRAAQGDLDSYGGATRLDGDQNAIIQASIKASRAKNVILIIGDGMGDSEITVARNYSRGAGGAFKGLDALPLTGQMTHYSLYKYGLPDYTPDSAATGTAWATGVKTYDNAVSVDIRGEAHKTLLQKAKASGRATGNVTTSEIEDATPAVEVANISLRSCYGPTETTKNCPEAAKENGGKGSIAEQLLDTRADVTFGGGSATYTQKATAGRYQGLTLAQQAQNRGYQYLTDAASLNSIASADQKSPVLGLFSTGNMPVKYAPLVATADGANGDAKRCTANPDFSQVPTLKAMTQKAITLLTKNKQGAKNGFFLQVESASIDKKDHSADACGQIGETEQIDEAIQAALAFARTDGNTLVVVTADHAHTSQIVDSPTPGLNTKLLTADGSPMIVSYGTSASGGSQQHTGTQVRVAGYGPGAANVVGLIDQTDLHFIALDAMSAWDTCQARKKKCK